MSVMSGFQVELLSRILGFNGHIGVVRLPAASSTNYDDIAGAHPRRSPASSR